MKKGLLVFFQLVIHIISTQFAQSQNFVNPVNDPDDINWVHTGSIDLSAIKDNYQADSLAYQQAQQKIINIKYQLSQDKKMIRYISLRILLKQQMITIKE